MEKLIRQAVDDFVDHSLEPWWFWGCTAKSYYDSFEPREMDVEKVGFEEEFY